MISKEREDFEAARITRRRCGKLGRPWPNDVDARAKHDKTDMLCNNGIPENGR